MENQGIIERIKKGENTAEIVLLESGFYRFRVYSAADSTLYDVLYTTSIQTAYMWLVGVLSEWLDATSLYRH